MTGITEITSFNLHLEETFPALSSPDTVEAKDSLPREIWREIFQRIPVSELLLMRTVCRYDKDLIEKSPILQRKISHEYLLKMHSKCNIPLDDLKYCLVDNKLGVEINSNLTLWKMTNSLSRTIPWIDHLIIKESSAPELNKLLTHLLKNHHLISLCLINCEVDSESQKHFLSLINTKNRPVFYFGNLKPINCEWTAPSNDVILIDLEKADTYSLEKFFGEESDFLALKKFEEAVSNESTSNQEVVEVMDALRPFIKSEIVTYIWYSCVMDGFNACDTPFLIHWKTHAFVEKNAHHPALIAATRKKLELSSALRH